MTDELLTIAEISKQLDIPESTVRFYRDRFEDYIPYVGHGRRRRYKREAIEVIRIIAEGMQSQRSAEEIEQELIRVHAKTVAPSAEPQDSTAVEQQQRQGDEKIILAMAMVTEQIKQSMSQISASMEATVKAQQEMMTEQQREVAALRKEIEEARAEQEKLLRETENREKQLIERIEKLEERKSFWGRMFPK